LWATCTAAARARSRFFLGAALTFDRAARTRLGRGVFHWLGRGLDARRRHFASTDDQRDGDRSGEKGAAVVLDTRQITVTYPFQNETVGRNQAQAVFKSRGFTFKPKRPDPGVELLRGQFLLEALQTGFPKTGHRRKHSSPRIRTNFDGGY